MASRPDPSEQTDPLFDLPTPSGSSPASPSQPEAQEAQLSLFDTPAASTGAGDRPSAPAASAAPADAGAPRSDQKAPAPQDPGTPWTCLLYTSDAADDCSIV